MCDCYEADCAGGCGNKISIHIADFCTKRENVHPYCPACIKAGKLTTYGENKDRLPGYEKVDMGTKCVQVFVQIIEDTYQIMKPGEEYSEKLDDLARMYDTGIGVIGEIVIITCDDLDAYGIRLN